MVLPAGAVSTAIPRSVAASTSIVSTPTPARPITFKPLARARDSRVICVALRTSTASAEAIASASSAPLRPGLTISSKRESSRSGSETVERDLVSNQYAILRGHAARTSRNVSSSSFNSSSV